jgi:hypothetical protein
MARGLRECRLREVDVQIEDKTRGLFSKSLIMHSDDQGVLTQIANAAKNHLRLL